MMPPLKRGHSPVMRLFFKYGQPRAQNARFNGLCPTASSVRLKCLIHASARLTDSIPGETATTAVTLIES